MLCSVCRKPKGRAWKKLKRISEITIFIMEKITQYLIQSTVHGSEVRAWEEDIMLPTYEIGKEEKNPIFLEKGFIREVPDQSILIRW